MQLMRQWRMLGQRHQWVWENWLLLATNSTLTGCQSALRLCLQWCQEWGFELKEAMHATVLAFALIVSLYYEWPLYLLYYASLVGRELRCDIWWRIGAVHNLWEPLGTYENHWEPRRTTGNLGEPLETYENHWEPMRTTGNLWEHRRTTENLWEPLRTYENHWEPMRTTAWKPRRTTGNLGEPLGTYENHWKPMRT